MTLSFLRFFTMLGLSAGFMISAGCNKHHNADAAGMMPPPEVNVVTIKPQDVPVTFEFTGQTAGSNETQVRARVNGILEKRLYSEGSFVKAGAPLFQIDRVPYQTQLAQAQAAVAIAQAQLNQAQREAARLKPLAAEKAVSPKEADDAQSAADIAQANLQQAQAKLKEAQLNLDYTTVTAPISGVTSIENQSNGSLITANSLLTTLTQTDPLYVKFSLTETELEKINQALNSGALRFSNQKNQSLHQFAVKVKSTDGVVSSVDGKLNFVSETINRDTGSFDARAELPNTERPNTKNQLRPGQFVRVILTGAVRTQAISIPQRAVINSPMGKIVFTVTPDNKLAPRPVQLGDWAAEGQWIVTQGLKAGDRVLVDGIIKAHDPGMTVKPKEVRS